MKIVGSFLEAINKDIAIAHQASLKATQELTRAVERQSRALESLAEVLSRNLSGRNYDYNNRITRDPNFREHFNLKDLLQEAQGDQDLHPLRGESNS